MIATRRTTILLQSSVERLRKVGIESARLDAELLLCAVLKCNRTQLLLRADDDATLDNDSLAKFESFMSRRLKREPIA